MTPRRALSIAIAACFVLASQVAFACPVCAADNDKTTLKIAAAFLAVPFVLAFFVIRAIVRAQRAE